MKSVVFKHMQVLPAFFTIFFSLFSLSVVTFQINGYFESLKSMIHPRSVPKCVSHIYSELCVTEHHCGGFEKSDPEIYPATLFDVSPI